MQTRTGGRLSIPKQQREKREAIAQFGNTLRIPSEILTGGQEAEPEEEEEEDEAGGLETGEMTNISTDDTS